jgi:hypothetical protein
MKYGLRDYRALCVKYESHLKRYGVWLGGIGMAAVYMMRLRLTGAHKKGHVRLGTRPYVVGLGMDALGDYLPKRSAFVVVLVNHFTE